MRLLIARVNHETNSFSPLPTPLVSFDPQWDADAQAAGEGSPTAMGAFLEFAKAREAEIVTPVFAMAFPSGPVSDEAFETMSQTIVDAAAAQTFDAILLDLHGAMVTDSYDDAEGELLARVRRAAPNVFIGVALDMHGNITPAMINAADVTVGFKTYPHIDMYETGKHVARIMGEVLDHGLKPVQSLIHPPILAQTLRMNTNEPCAMTRAVAAAKEAEKRDGVHAATIFGGFPLSDLAETGVSIVVVADSEPLVQQTAQKLAETIWQERQGFVYAEQPLSESVTAAEDAAAQSGEGRVLMLDHGDNCMSGGTCDVMDVLAQSLRHGLNGILAGPIADREAVAAMRSAGLDKKITVGIGNRWALEKIGINKPPLELSGTVRFLGRGQYTISGPIYTGMFCDMGDAAVLETDQALILVVERPHEPWDLGVFACADIDPSESSYLILKSRMYCRPIFEPMAKAVVECASQGVTSSNFDLFDFKKLTHPIFPLDRM